MVKQTRNVGRAPFRNGELARPPAARFRRFGKHKQRPIDANIGGTPSDAPPLLRLLTLPSPADRFRTTRCCSWSLGVVYRRGRSWESMHGRTKSYEHVRGQTGSYETSRALHTRRCWGFEPPPAPEWRTSRATGTPALDAPRR